MLFNMLITLHDAVYVYVYINLCGKAKVSIYRFRKVAVRNEVSPTPIPMLGMLDSLCW